MAFFSSLWSGKAEAGPPNRRHTDPAAPAQFPTNPADLKDRAPEAVVDKDIHTEAPASPSEKAEKAALVQTKTIATGEAGRTTSNHVESPALNAINDPEETTQSGQRRRSSANERNLLLTHVGAQQQQQSDIGPHASERLRTWQKVSNQHAVILKKRVLADEIRRRARVQRQSFVNAANKLVGTALGNAPAQSAEPSPQVSALVRALSELEALEIQVEEIEDDLVQAESAARKILPPVPGSDLEQTYEVLDQNDFYFPTASSESAVSDRRDPEADVDPSPEHKNLLLKLDEIDFLEEPLQELRDDKQRLRTRDEKQLNSEELTFLHSYDSRKDQLKAELRRARSELEDLRDTLQPQPFLGDIEQPQPSEHETDTSITRPESDPDQNP